MGRGFLAGIFWGGLIGLFLIVFSNQVMDRRVLSFPQPDAEPVEVPAGTEFDQARPESDPVVPEAETRPGAEVIAGVQAPEDLSETPPSFDTSSLEVPTPTIENQGTLGEAPAPADEPEVAVIGPGDAAVPDEAPALTAPDAPATSPEASTASPDNTDAPEVTEDPTLTAPTVEDAPDVEVTTTITAPTVDSDAGTAPALPRAEAPAAPAPSVAPEAAPTPEVADGGSGVSLPGTGSSEVAVLRPDGGESQFFQPVDEMTDRAPDVETDRLPRVGVGVESDEPAEDGETTLPTIRRLPGQDEEDEAELDVATPSAPNSGPALSRWSMAHTNPDNLPLVSVVLVHDGAGAEIADVIRAAPAPVAIAVRAGDAGAAEIASAYRAAGREVVMIPSLPEAASPQDVEVALQSNFATIPEAVAVMDSTGETFQADRDAVAQIVDVISDTGHGLITFPRGLNTALQKAERQGVAAALVFRDIDGTGQTPDQILRGLDRAAFRARQDEAVILVGRTRGATLAALTEWALGNRAQTISFAPVSAALAGQ